MALAIIVAWYRGIAWFATPRRAWAAARNAPP
jgi:hypothetical protein